MSATKLPPLEESDQRLLFRILLLCEDLRQGMIAGRGALVKEVFRVAPEAKRIQFYDEIDKNLDALISAIERRMQGVHG